MATHKDLEVWKRAVDFVTEVYRATKTFPEEERFGLQNQIRRASISIPSNIAEGAARKGNAEFSKFLYYSLGSAAELDTQLLIASNLKYLDAVLFDKLIEELSIISRMIQGLIKSIK